MRLRCHIRPGTPSTPCTAPRVCAPNPTLAKALALRARYAVRLARGSRLSVEALKAYRTACATVEQLRAPPMTAVEQLAAHRAAQRTADAHH